MECKICGEDYPSKYYFKTEDVCIECYKKQHPEEFKQKKIKKSKNSCAICGGEEGLSFYFYHPKIQEKQYYNGVSHVTETTYSPNQNKVLLCSKCINKRTKKFLLISLSIFAVSLLILIIVASSVEGELEGFPLVLIIATFLGMIGGLHVLGFEGIFLSTDEKGDRTAGEFDSSEFKTRKGFQKLLKKNR